MSAEYRHHHVKKKKKEIPNFYLSYNGGLVFFAKSITASHTETTVAVEI